MSNKSYYSTHPKPISPTRISHIDFSDLSWNLNSITKSHIFTKCELIILRSRDKAIGITQDEKLLLDLIANEIHNLSKNYEKGKNS